MGDSRKSLEFQIEWDIDGSLTWEPWRGVRSLMAVRKWVQSPNRVTSPSLAFNLLAMFFASNSLGLDLAFEMIVC